jgi:hypothetical protein
MTDHGPQKTSPIFDLNYVFEPRWGSSTFDDDDVLEISDFDEEVRIQVSFADANELLLGRGSAQATNDLGDEKVKTSPDDTISTISAEFRKKLLQMAATTDEEQERARKLQDDSLPVIDLRPLNADMFGVSRKHAVLEKDEQRLTLTDLGSTNGTHLNGTLLYPMQRRIIRDGDEVQLGNLRLRVRFRKTEA